MISLQTLIWLLPVAFALHDGEELLTAEGWIRRNPGPYQQAPKGLRLDEAKSITAQFAIAVAVVGSAVLLAAMLGARSFATNGSVPGIFIGALAVMCLDGLKHLLTSLYLRQYTAGVVSAALIELPYTLYAFYRLFEARLVSWGEALTSGLIGVLVILPLLGLGFALGRWLAPARRRPLTADR